jgi:thiol-disulfide isomerase/thioredoxin
MGKSKTVSIIGLTLVALALWGCGGGERPADTGETREVAEEALPESFEAFPEGFELLPGDQFNVEDYKGKVLVLDFWATWCPPCMMEIPELIEINDEYGDKGVVMVGITGDEDAEKSVPKFAKESGLNYRNYIMSDAIDKQYNITGWPTKVIYDADGNEVFRQTGYMTKEQLVAEIEKYLPGV